MSALEPVKSISGGFVPLFRDNVDTDAIIPSREMKSTGKTGLADGLFAGWRYVEGRTINPDFVLNQPEYQGLQILVGGDNFGSGSSREHAVWALKEYGFRAIVAGSFAPIFRNNCIRNGVVPAAIGRPAAEQIARSAGRLTVDVEAGLVSVEGGDSFPFALDEESRAMLVEGLDAIDLTLKFKPAIEAFLAKDRPARPWIYLGDKA